MPYKNIEDRRKNDRERRRRIYSTQEGIEKQRAAVRNSMARTGYLLKPEVVERRRLANKTPQQKRQQRIRKILAYGITPETHDLMAMAQQHRCAICGIEERVLKTKLHIDHDHRSNKVRALLCQRCNAAIGLFDDEPKRLEAAANYLRRFGCG